MSSIIGAVFIATSFDGFIARNNGDIEWLTSGATEGEDYGYDAFMVSVDLLVMGRNTYEKVLSFEGDWPYPKKVIVLSRTLTQQQIPERLQEKVLVDAGPAEDLMQRLEKDGIKKVYVDGGQVIQSLLRANMIQELIVTRIPILLGSGIPLFGELPADIKLQHVATQSYENSFVQSTYRVLSTAA